MPARKAPASPAAARPTSTPTTSSCSSPRPSCTASTRPSCSERSSGRSARQPDAQRWLAEMEQAQAQLVELAAAYGNREISMDEWRAARKPIEQRLTARPQAAREGLAHVRARPLHRQRRRTARRVGLARPQPATRDRRRRDRLRASSARPGAATTASTSRA